MLSTPAKLKTALAVSDVSFRCGVFDHCKTYT